MHKTSLCKDAPDISTILCTECLNLQKCMFPTTRNLQIRVYVYRPRHCCGDWLTFGCFVPMISDHDLVKKVINNHGCFVSMLTFVTMIIEESVCFMSCEPIYFCNYSYVVHTEYIYIWFFSSTEHWVIAHER